MVEATLPHPQPMTAEEFVCRHTGDYVELINGVVEVIPASSWKHGSICFKVAYELGVFVEPRRLGRIVTNDSFVQTKWNPDSVRGGDVCFMSYARLPAGPLPEGLLPVAPELVFEVKSPSNTVSQLSDKAAEYLVAGVKLVVIVDPATSSVRIHRPDEFPETRDNGDELDLEPVLPGFRIPVKRLFE